MLASVEPNVRVLVKIMKTMPTTAIFLSKFSIKKLLLWLAYGALIPLCATYWDNNTIPVAALQYGSGFGVCFAIVILFVSVFGLVAVVPNRVQKLSAGDFLNFYRFALGGSFRASGVLLGFFIGAIATWIISGIQAALACALMSLTLSISLWFCWCCIVVIAAHLEQPPLSTVP